MITSLLSSTSQRQVQALAIGATLIGTSLLINVIDSAEALSCQSRKTYIRTAYPNGSAKQDGHADNSVCSGGGSTLDIKIMEHKTGAPGQEITQSFWYVSGPFHERHAYACDPDDGQFYAEQQLNGNEKSSTYGVFEDCYVQ